jgi:integrase
MQRKITKEAVDRMAPGVVLWDTEVAGFGVRRQVDARAYLIKYRFKGRQRLLTLGKHGRITPEEARRLAKRHLGRIAEGKDPAEEMAAAKKPATDLFGPMVDRFIERHAKRETKSWERTAWIFRKYVTPVWGSRSISSIKRRDVAELLDKIEDENGPVAAQGALAQIRKLFNWLAVRDDEFVSPIVRGMGRIKPKERARTRVLTDDEIRALWAASARARGLYGHLVRFLLLTASRRDEAALAPWTELDDEGVWTIPADRFKSGHQHVVPLPEAAREIIGGLTRLGPLVFANAGYRPMGGLSDLKRQLDAAMLEELRKSDPAAELAPWVLHDIRRTAKTLMSRAGVRPDISERVLGHAMPGVEGVYDRHSYLDEKRDALEKLAAMVERVIAPPASNVVALPRTA